MIVDSSVIIAILRGEDDTERYLQAIEAADSPRISAANYVEAGIVAEAEASGAGARQLDAFLRATGIGIEPVTVDQSQLALQAWSDYGKGRHRAKLNYGDCFAYALAKATGESLLFKGDDFRLTDVQAAL